MNNRSDDGPAESIAYREAGHAVMAYLIVNGGITDARFAAPISQGARELLVPAFEVVAADGELSKLAHPTFSLRSLITVPLFIFAGFAAQRIHEDPSAAPVAGNSKAEGLARGMMHSYWEEFGGETLGPDSALQQAIQDSNEFAYQTVRNHWQSVQALAEHLLEERELSRAEAFKVVEGHQGEK